VSISVLFLDSLLTFVVAVHQLAAPYILLLLEQAQSPFKVGASVGDDFRPKVVAVAEMFPGIDL
jgi:hypothetical protein